MQEYPVSQGSQVNRPVSRLAATLADKGGTLDLAKNVVGSVACGTLGLSIPQRTAALDGVYPLTSKLNKSC